MPDALTPEQLGSFAEKHLLYEVEMLRGLTLELQRVVDRVEEGGDHDDLYPLAVRNAMVESFVIRTRLLTDFIYGYGSHEDDTFAKHYVEGAWDPATIDRLEEAKKVVNKGVAHLTYYRLLIEKKEWQYGLIWLDLAQLLEDFVRKASPDRLPPDVAAKILTLLEPIESPHLIASASRTDSPVVISTASDPISVSSGIPTTSVSDLIDQQKRKKFDL
jgi:hypothetical protein